jgi:sugar O-acyltransferase (sialic acid O-acetyltransferase NeuD family)
MGIKLLILGKGDNIVTMILDNIVTMMLDKVYLDNTAPTITIYNNLKLPILNTFEHDWFNLNVVEDVNMDEYNAFTLGVYQPKHKKKIIQSLFPDTNKFINIVHSGLDISKTSFIGIGALINSKVSIAAHTIIGNFVSINRHVSIGHHTTISDYCSINPGTNIAGNVTIGEGTTIGMGVNIIDGVKIGKNTIIGAGSVVTKDIPDNVVAYGSPCKIIRENG